MANPSASSSSPLPPPQATKSNKLKEPFSHQAAKFSAYTPFILGLLGTCIQGQTKAHAGTDVGLQLALVLGGLSFLTTLTAFVLGIVGLVGGIARRSGWTMGLALFGVILNTGVLAVWWSVFFFAHSRTRAVIPATTTQVTWTKVNFDTPKVSFAMPGSPTQNVQTIGDQAQVTVTSYQFFDGMTNFGALTVKRAESAQTPRSDDERAKLLDGGLDAWRKSVNGRTVYQESVSLGELSGREQHFEIDPPENTTRAAPVLGIAIGKSFLVEGQVVTLTVVSEKDAYEKDAAVQDAISRFFASLRVGE